MSYEHQDWTTVYVHKKHTGASASDKNVVRAAQRNGHAIDTVTKVKGEVREYSDMARKLESDIHVAATESAPPPPPLLTLNGDMRKLMIQARVGRKLTQQQLAQSVNLPVKLIQDLEGGKVIQHKDKAALSRINRFLGCNLRF